MQNNEKLVSIVIPTYNRADRLPEAIESCLAQTYENIELIIVDDGSTDITEEVVQPFLQRDSRVRYFKKKNGKLPRALNYGFDRAKGYYLTWTSDDNRYFPNAIEQMVRAQQEFGKDCLVYADYVWKNRITGEERHYSNDDIRKIERTNIIGACFLYTKNIKNAVGEYNPSLFLVEDYDYWLRIYKKFPVVHLKKELYEYWEHKTTLTNIRRYEIPLLALYIQKKHKVFRGKSFYRRYLDKLTSYVLFSDKKTLAQKLKIMQRLASEAVKIVLLSIR